MSKESLLCPWRGIFLLISSSRSKRKGADLGGGSGTGKDAQQRTTAGNNGGGNGVCPVPETAAPSTAAGCTSSTGGTKKTGLVSFSQTGSAKSARKTVQSVDTCVADSFDEQMIDKICTVPMNMDQNEWLASHVLALFEHVNGISCTLSETCTPVTCSVMNYPGNQKAPWIDERGKRHNYSAMRYIDSVMSFCEASRQNQVLFPTKYGAPFSPDFESHCARMVRLLWHCLGHMYHKHWEHIGALNLRPQFGLVLVHMTRLAKMYSLLQEKEWKELNNTLQLVRPTAAVAVGGLSPPQQQQQQPQQPQQQRSLKRGLVDDSAAAVTGSGEETATTGGVTATAQPVVNPNTVQGRIQQHQRKQQQQNAGKEQQQKKHHHHQKQHQQSSSSSRSVSSSKKGGSWGGNSSAVAVMAAAAAAQQANNNNNCQQKCYAQTC